jgi:hypothetical protein
VEYRDDMERGTRGVDRGRFILSRFIRERVKWRLKILSTSFDNTVKEWDAATGECLNTYKRNDPNIPFSIHRYVGKDVKKRLKIDGNTIRVTDSSGKIIRELINVPGLFIHGCSFQNLEKESQWSQDGLKILKMYHAIV